MGKNKPSFRKLWMFPRNMRRIEPWKLVKVCTVLDNNAGIVGNQQVQDQLYAILARDGVKAQSNPNGVHNAGGFRTYLSQLACLGLFWQDPQTLKYIPTYAGDCLMQGGEPLKVLRCQLLRMQYPSVYGLGSQVKIDPSLKIKPLCFLITLLQDDRLGRQLSAQDMAIAVVYAHTWKDYEGCVQKILALRQANGDLSKIIVCDEDLKTPKRYENKGTGKSLRELGLEDVVNIANTAKNYLQAALLIVPDGKVNKREVFALNDDPAVLAEIAPYLKEKTKIEPLVEGHEAAWQQRYGRYDKQKAVRSLQTRHRVDPFLVSIKVSYIAALESDPFGFNESAFITDQAQRWGRHPSDIAKAITSIKPHTTTVERDSVLAAAVSGGTESEILERAVCSLFKRLGFESSLQIGQRKAKRRGGFPDVYIRTRSLNKCAMADSKASSRYDFGLGDTMKLSSYYKDCELELTENVDAARSSFFLYVAGGFHRQTSTIEHKLAECAKDYARPVSAITIQALLDLAAQAGQVTPAQIMSAFEQGKYFTSSAQIMP